MATLYAKSAGGNWSSAGTWSNVSSASVDSSGPPTSADEVIFDSGSGNVTIGATAECRSIDTDTYTNQLDHEGYSLLVGDGTAATGNRILRFGAGMTYIAGGLATKINFVSTSATPQTITTNGILLRQVVFDAAGSFVLGDDIQCSSTILHNYGEFDTANFDITCLGLFSSVSNVREIIFGSSTITLISISSPLNFNATNLTFDCGTSNIVISGPGSGAKSFVGGSQTFYDITIDSPNVVISGDNTFRYIYNNMAGEDPGLVLDAGSTQVIEDYICNGTTGNLCYLSSDSPGSPATLSKSSGTLSLDYVSITDITATGGATFEVGYNSIDGGGNTGWDFAGVLATFSGIDGEEAFGSHAASLNCYFSGIGSEEAFGSCITSVACSFSGVAGEEAFGDLESVHRIAGIGSEEAFGILTTSLNCSFSGIDTEETFGLTESQMSMGFSGIGSEEAFGSHSYYFNISLSGISGEEDFGLHIAQVSLSLAGIAGAEAFGTPTKIISYSYASDGGEVLITGVGDAVYSIFFELDIQWQTKTTIFIEKTFLWDVGEQLDRWYRIQGACRFPTSSGDGFGGVAGGCDVISLETDDTSCLGALGKQQFIQIFVAKGLTDLCQQLKASGLRWQISSIKRFSQPADLRLVASDDNCNILTEVPYCEIPECLEYCIDGDSLIRIEAEVLAHPVFVYVVNSGEVITGGEGVTSTDGDYGESYFEYVSEDGEVDTTTDGVETSSSWDVDLTTEIIAEIAIIGEEAIFGIAENIPEIPIVTNTIITDCGLCNNMPVNLNINHNLSKAGTLVEFLQRNGIIMPSTLSMYYSKRLKSWTSNYHIIGIGDDNLNSSEKWRFTFDWSCVDQFGGTDLGTSYWKFSMLVVRSNTAAGTNFETRLVIGFPPEQICDDADFDLSFTVNTVTEYISNDLNLILDDIVLSDNIGLFKSKSWIKNPLLKLNISNNESDNATQYQDIYPIFPKTQSIIGA